MITIEERKDLKSPFILILNFAITLLRLKEAILEVVPTAKVIPFGSFATCLYLPHGDIDLVI